MLKTWKYPIRGYIQGVLKHTTAWDQHWKSDEILKCGFTFEYMWLGIA